jgi:hypothetical protein
VDAWGDDRAGKVFLKVYCIANQSKVDGYPITIVFKDPMKLQHAFVKPSGSPINYMESLSLS